MIKKAFRRRRYLPGQRGFFARDAFSYFRTTCGPTKAHLFAAACRWTSRSIGPGRMVKELVPDIRKNMHVIAKEEVEVEQLHKQIAQTQSRRQGARRSLAVEKRSRRRAKRVPLRRPAVHGRAGQEGSGKSLRAVQDDEATLASLKDIEQARRRSLAAAREKLEGMLAAKRKLEVDVEHSGSPAEDGRGGADDQRSRSTTAG